MEIADLTSQGTDMIDQYGSKYVEQGEQSVIKAFEVIQGTSYGQELGLGKISAEKVKKITGVALQAAGLYMIYNSVGRHWKKLAVVGIAGFLAIQLKMYLKANPSGTPIANQTLPPV